MLYPVELRAHTWPTLIFCSSKLDPQVLQRQTAQLAFGIKTAVENWSG